MTFQSLKYEQLDIKHDSVFEFMGYGVNTPDDSTKEETLRMIKEISHIAKPKVCFQVFYGNLELEDETLLIHNGKVQNANENSAESIGEQAFKVGRIVSRQLRGAQAYALFICTAGVEFQRFQEQLKAEGDIVRSYIADAIGSTIAECCADQMELILQKSIDKLGWHRTNRFSPGYCGWHVSEQRKLFSFFPPEPCGVKLTDSSLMLPIKSVSGVIGLGPEVRYNEYTCGLCDYFKCYKRKKKSQQDK